MTDESTENESGPATATATEEPVADETATLEHADDALVAEHEHHGESHPYRERYLVPFLMPLGVVVVVVAFIISVSRIFLSSHGHASVIAGTIITAGILIGAAALSAAPKMRSGTIGMATAGLFVVILFGGWLTVGHAEPHEEAGGTLDPNLYSQAIKTSSSEDLRYSPPDLTASTGLVQITMDNLGGEHTLNFDDTSTQFDNLHALKEGDVVSAVTFFEKAGEYSFFCAIPGHQAAGMEGKVTVTGVEQDLETATTAAEESTGAEGDGETETPEAP